MTTVKELGAVNLRDLGGQVGQDGRKVRHGLLFRSEFPNYLDGEGVAVLRVRTALDLRRAEELALESHHWAEWGVRHHHVPLTAGGASSWRAGYQRYLEEGPTAVVDAVSTLISPGALPAIFFCAAGKDRTGVVATLVLSVLGVHHDSILRDHARSAVGIDQIVARLAPTPPYAAQLDGLSVHDLAPHPDFVTSLLDWLDVRGGSESWLISNGVEADHLTTFREMLLEPATS